MKALLIIAHGSRNPQSNTEIERLTVSVRLLDHGYDLVGHGFLELAEPNMDTALKNLVDRGATDITVLPYFLARGNHVARDIETWRSESVARIDGISITLMSHIGAATGMPELIRRHLLAERKG